MRSIVPAGVLTAALLAAHSSASADDIRPVPFKTAAKLADQLMLLSPHQTRIGGWLGDRVLNNERNRLVQVDLEPLLAGFRQRPGSHPWIGEHIGKWMHAATLAWAYTGDAELRQKLDYAAAELIKTQEPDGYLGTYVPGQRFGLYRGADWDVWSHKYNLMGLLTYYQYTGNPAALEACRRMGDLLVRTFPAEKSILAAGTHVGMAATSVLEPMVLLYRQTGDERYLDFCQYIVAAWDEPKGPKIIAALLAERQVNKTANAKAYEMLSNLVGLCELARATGDRQLLEPVLIAWQDIVDKRLYLTGTASQGEHFPEDHDLPNDSAAHVGETCVTTTWIQLNSQLLRLTGEARFGDQLEKTWLNHLAAAQRPDGAEWCYFTALEGVKPYGPGISCCVSSGPRGMAMVPQHACLVRPAANAAEADALVVNLFGPGTFSGMLDGGTVTVEQQTDFPRSGHVTIVVKEGGPRRFAIQVRAPQWAQPVAMAVNGEDVPTAADKGWIKVPARPWSGGDKLELELHVGARMILGDHGNAGRAALAWGPLVLAYDMNRSPQREAPALLVLGEIRGRPQLVLRSSPGEPLRWETMVRSVRQPEPHPAVFVPFADAGADGGRYQVWLRAPGEALPQADSLSAFMPESRSREGNVAGSVTDGDASTFVVTFDGRPAQEDWFAVEFDAPATVGRVTFVHGQTFHDGGWFDTSGGKPEIQIKRAGETPWETVARLDTYPATTATDSQRLKPGQAFTLSLPQPVRAVALRVVGKPASGDNPRQAFSSCAELQVFAP